MCYNLLEDEENKKLIRVEPCCTSPYINPPRGKQITAIFSSVETILLDNLQRNWIQDIFFTNARNLYGHSDFRQINLYSRIM